MALLLFYLISLFYCSIQLIRRYRKMKNTSSIDNVPGLDFLMMLITCPYIAILDVSLTWIKIYKEYEKEIDTKGKVF